MAYFKIIYKSRLILHNKFVVEADDEAQAKKRFKKEYTDLGGNFSNVIDILSIDKAEEGENLNNFYKS